MSLSAPVTSAEGGAAPNSDQNEPSTTSQKHNNNENKDEASMNDGNIENAMSRVMMVSRKKFDTFTTIINCLREKNPTVFEVSVVVVVVVVGRKAMLTRSGWTFFENEQMLLLTSTTLTTQTTQSILSNHLDLSIAEFDEIESSDGASTVGDDSTVFTDPNKLDEKAAGNMMAGARNQHRDTFLKARIGEGIDDSLRTMKREEAVDCKAVVAAAKKEVSTHRLIAYLDSA